MRSEQLRALLLEYLKDPPSRQGALNFDHCVKGVSGLAQKRCPDELDSPGRLHAVDFARLKHVVWDLILERVLVPGTDHPGSSIDGWPFISITDHGKKVVAEQRAVPYDPDGYLYRLNEATEGLLPTVEAYLAEALTTFRTGSNLASAVMLGAASEMVFIELCEAIAESFVDANKKKAFQAKTAPKRKMVQRVNAVAGWLANHRSQLPPEWQDAERHRLIEKVADLIRNRRNESGHPQNTTMKPSHEEMYALLMLFPDYCEKLYDLKTWLETQKGAIS